MFLMKCKHLEFKYARNSSKINEQIIMLINVNNIIIHAANQP